MTNQYHVAGTTDIMPSRQGNEHGTIYPYNSFPTADGELIVVAANNGQFARLCRELELDELIDDERFDSPEHRNLNRDELRPYLVEVLGRKGKHEWYEQLSAAGLPVSPVQNVLEGFDMAEQLGLQPLWESGNPGDVPTVRNPLTFDTTPPTYRKAPPAMNEDADAILRWLETDS